MSDYKNVLTGYVNQRQDGSGRSYLVITNVSDKPFTLEPNGKVYLNMTPEALKAKNSRMPNFTKSVAVNDEDMETPY